MCVKCGGGGGGGGDVCQEGRRIYHSHGRERDAVRGAASLISHRFPSHVPPRPVSLKLSYTPTPPLPTSNDMSGVLVAVKGALFRAYYACDSETETLQHCRI